MTKPASIVGSAKIKSMPHRTPRIAGVDTAFPACGYACITSRAGGYGHHEVALREITETCAREALAVAGGTEAARFLVAGRRLRAGPVFGA